VCTHAVFLVRSVEQTTALGATVRGLPIGSRDKREPVASPAKPQYALRLPQNSVTEDLSGPLTEVSYL
jgi:hypothetical protein